MATTTSKNDQSVLDTPGTPTVLPVVLRESERAAREWLNDEDVDAEMNPGDDRAEPAEAIGPNVQNLDNPAIAAESPGPEEGTKLPAPTSSWTDDQLIHCCGTSVKDGNEAEVEGLSLLRRSIRLRWRGCVAASILHKRHKTTREWVKVLKKSKLPRSTLSEMVRLYDSVTALGHGEEDVAKYRIWTEVKEAYGVVKPKKSTASDVGAGADGVQGPAHSEPADQPEETALASQIGTAATTTDASPAATTLEGSASPGPEVEGEGNGPSGPADAEIGDPQEGHQTPPVPATAAKPDETKGQSAAKAKKPKLQPDQGDPTPTELGYAEAFVSKMGGWKHTATVVESVTQLIAGVVPATWERAALAIQAAKAHADEMKSIEGESAARRAAAASATKIEDAPQSAAASTANPEKE